VQVQRYFKQELQWQQQQVRSLSLPHRGFIFRLTNHVLGSAAAAGSSFLAAAAKATQSAQNSVAAISVSSRAEFGSTILTYTGRCRLPSLSSKSTSYCITNSRRNGNAGCSRYRWQYHRLHLDHNCHLLPCHTTQEKCQTTIT
jgi:hypothetical protein